MPRNTTGPPLAAPLFRARDFRPPGLAVPDANGGELPRNPLMALNTCSCLRSFVGSMTPPPPPTSSGPTVGAAYVASPPVVPETGAVFLKTPSMRPCGHCLPFPQVLFIQLNALLLAPVPLPLPIAFAHILAVLLSASWPIAIATSCPRSGVPRGGMQLLQPDVTRPSVHDPTT